MNSLNDLIWNEEEEIEPQNAEMKNTCMDIFSCAATIENNGCTNCGSVFKEALIC